MVDEGIDRLDRVWSILEKKPPWRDGWDLCTDHTRGQKLSLAWGFNRATDFYLNTPLYRCVRSV